MASIFSIVYQPEDQNYTGERVDYIRLPLDQAKLIAGYGLQGDQKAGHNPERQLNLLSRERMETLSRQGYRTEPGQFGEQITITGLAVDELPPGTQLQLGAEAVIEVTRQRTGCERFEAAQLGKSRAGLGPLGVLAKVIQGGTIKVGDPVSTVEVVR